MPRDFRTTQIQTNKVIASGSTGTGAKLLFYSIEADDSGSPNQGIINTSVFDTGNVGNDAFAYFSGSIDALNSNLPGAVVFGGDVFVSGNFDVAGALFDASASNVYNDSNVTGDKVNDALNHLDGAKAESATALTASVLVNDSSVTGDFIDDALDRLDLKVTASGPVTDQRIARWSGSGGVTLEDTGIRIDNSDNMSLINEITASSGLINGNLEVNSIAVISGITGSHLRLSAGIDAFLAGPNVTLNFSPLGQLEITGSAGGGGADTDWEETGTALYTTSSVNISSSLAVENAITASSITNGAQYHGTTLVSSSGGGTYFDAAVGPNYELELTENTLFENPVNAVDGQSLTVGIRQDATGGRTVIFDSDWVPVGQLEDVALASGSYSVMTAVARDFGDGVIWQYAFSHAETLTGLIDLDASGSTTSATPLTIASVLLSGDQKSGLLDYSIHAKITGSAENAQFGMRSLIYRTGSVVTVEDENLYSLFESSANLAITHSVNSLVVDIQVIGSASANVDWKIKGIFEEI